MSKDAAIAVGSISQKYLSAKSIKIKDSETAIFEIKIDALKLIFPNITFVAGVINKSTDIDLKI